MKVVHVFKNVYVILRGNLNPRVLSVWSTEEAARAAFDAMPEPEDDELTMEQWPLDEPKTRFTVRVVAWK